MNTTFIAMAVAILLGIGLLVGIGALSLLSGALNFLFVKPKIEILKSKFGDSGFAFSFSWDQSAEPVRFDRLKLHLFNPFGLPAQLEITREFDASGVDFARDLELGSAMKELLSAKGLDKATLEIEVSATKDKITHKSTMNGAAFIGKISAAKVTAEEMNEKLTVKKEKPRFQVPERTFISPPLPKTAKQLKMATNPIFAGEFAGAAAGAAAAGPAVQNFSVSKVWIEPGCIVCNACEGIYPEVFEVTDTTCLIRPNAPLNDGLKIQEAAEACPVEVIKFTKAS
ncbi:MAG: ferredoxin [Bacteriovorax sp.]